MTIPASSNQELPKADSQPEEDLHGDIHVQEPESDDNRRNSSDRRAEDRRRSAKGLFELRARRDKVAADRRQLQRRGGSRFRLAFWRRMDA